MELSGMNVFEFLEARITEDEVEAVERVRMEWSDGGWTDTHCHKIISECAAKRATIKVCQEDYEDSLKRNDDVVDTSTAVIHLLAYGYSVHPDYRQDWAE